MTAIWDWVSDYHLITKTDKNDCSVSYTTKTGISTNKPTHRQAHYAFWQPHNTDKKCVKSLPFPTQEKISFPFFFLFFSADTQRTTNSHSH